MFGIGGWEFMIIAALALLLFGPDKLPQFARTVGRVLRDFKRYQALLESTLRAEIYTTEPAGDDQFKKGAEFRERVEAGEFGGTPGGGTTAVETDAVPPESLTPEERAASLKVDHPLKASIAAGADVGLDDDLDLSTLGADDLGWVPGTGSSGEGVDGTDA